MLNEFACYATLPAADMERARRWYSEKLGLEPVRVEEVGANYETGKGTGFLLYPSSFAGTNQGTAMSFDVADFDGELAELRRRGVTLEDYDLEYLKTENGVATLPDGARACWFKDSEGNILAMGELR